MRIWSIGNENYWPTEIGHKPIEQWAAGLLFQLTGKIRIDDILAGHYRFQRFRVRNIAFHHTHTVGVAR